MNHNIMTKYTVCENLHLGIQMDVSLTFSTDLNISADHSQWLCVTLQSTEPE